MYIVQAQQEMVITIYTAMKEAERAMLKECSEATNKCRLEVLNGYADTILKLSMALDKIRI